ncbi:DUF3515 family protein [Lysinibacter sp. HNR]|uniref:DUF3515 family protein n=1 Tax=Lysinibacter sp. HNR TaxID=3031408 RepID=UPI0024352EA5|nr:DUF3515 family protein [Lysinibacter sp. HNR]WGD38394.1 DUF3515 family protein [Lysinibacter sp. HNR]
MVQNPIRRGPGTRSLTGISLVAVATLLLAGCAGDVALQPAANANDPACADLMVQLPKTLADMPKRSTNAQSTSAWGNPANVLLYCGITPSGPTELPCTTINGVDWITDDSRAPLYRFEAYGRSPGLEVVIDTEGFVDTAGTIPIVPSNVLVDLEMSAKKLPQERSCTSARDLNNLPGESE